MKLGMWVGALALSLGITSTAFGQIAPVASGAAASTAAPANLWSFLLPTAEQKAACKATFCASPIGKLASGASGSLSMMSGGLFTNRCATNALAKDLEKSATSSEGAAARIKKNEEEAKARRLAIRYLGTVDCNYWDEAQEALIVGLRKDPSECVRFEAALALRNGCCCKKEVIKALEMCVAGKSDDGAPVERSERVRAAALEALERCPLMNGDPEIKKKSTLTKNETNPSVDPKEYYKKVGQMSEEQVLASARATLVSMKERGKVQIVGGGVHPSSLTPSAPQRPGSLAGIVNHAFAPEGSGAPRQPFFSGLTRALTGKQDSGYAGRSEMVMPARIGAIRTGDAQIGARDTIVPAPTAELASPQPREFKAPTPVEIVQPLPSGPQSNAPRGRRGYITVDPVPPMLPPLPNIVPSTKP